MDLLFMHANEQITAIAREVYQKGKILRALSQVVQVYCWH